MTLLQVIAVVFLLALLAIILNYLRRNEFDLFLFLMTVTIVALIFLVLFPLKILDILHAIGFLRPVDAFFTLVSVSALLFCVKNYLGQKRIQRGLTKVVQAMALSDGKKRQ
jgi:hypothetical protein